MTWITDSNNNRASVERWGSEEAAREALATLIRCYDCSDCYGCSDCSDCSDCSGCSVCYGCSDCSDCSDCYDCYGCSDCSDCSGCSVCSGCSGCSRCSGCSDKKEQLPEIPKIEAIHQKVYQAASKPNCLDMNKWHSCETTHCRAGWVVHLAGEAGYALEKKTSPLFAAMQIYKASGYEISPCRFFDSNEKALEDMEKLAASSNQESP